MTDIKRILFWTDLGPTANRAWPVAARIVRSTAAQPILVATLPRLSPRSEATLSHRQIVERMDRARQRIHEGFRLLLAAANLDAGSAILRAEDGVPLYRIIQAAEEEEADLIVIGAPSAASRRWWSPTDLASRLARWAPCPVIIVEVPGSRTIQEALRTAFRRLVSPHAADPATSA